MEWVWLCGGYVDRPILEMRLAVVLYSCLVCSVAMWVLRVRPVARIV